MVGRFEVGTTKEREFAWGKVTFDSIYHITVETSSMTVIFHRYGTSKGYYTNSWTKFRRALLKRDIQSIYGVYKYADRFDVAHYVKEMKLVGGHDEKLKSKEENGKDK